MASGVVQATAPMIGRSRLNPIAHARHFPHGLI
jgi:hypothetical protein